MKELELAPCPGLLFKNGRYHFQARVPDECLAAWRKRTGKRGPTYTAPLDTRDLMEARRIIRAEKWPEHYRMLEQLRAGPISTIDPEEVEQLAAQWIVERFEEDTEDLRDESGDRLFAAVHRQLSEAGIVPLEVGPTPQQDRAYLKRKENLEWSGENLRHAYVRGKAPMGFDDEMGGFLLSRGLEVANGSAAYQALRRALLDAERKVFDMIERRHQGHFVEAPVAPPERQSVPTGPTLDSCLEKWKLKKTRPAKTVSDASAAIESFEAHHGKRGVLEYSRRDAIAWRDSLLHSPARPLHAKTVNKKLALLRAVVQVSIDDEMDGLSENSPNPFRKAGVREAKGAKPRVSYSSEQLNLLFSSPVFVRHDRPKAGRGEAAYWLPVLALYTGARLEELGQLRLQDVKEERGVPCLFLCPEAGSIKAGIGRRVPVHPELKRLGFLEYVDSLRSGKAVRVFSKLQHGPGGKLTDSWSKWYGRYLRGTVKITDKRITFHSFRHSFKDACREAGLTEEQHDALTGHTGGGVGRAYGGDGFPIGVLADSIGRVAYPGINELPQWEPR